MTTIQLAQRLILDLGEKDLSLVGMDTRTALVGVINATIQRYYVKTPPFMRESPLSAQIFAPKTINIVVEDGSNSFEGYAINENDTYNTIIIDGDSTKNQIVGNNTLLDHYQGASGERRAVIYSDAIPLYEPIKRLVDDPYLKGEIQRKLTYRSESDISGSYYGYGSSNGYGRGNGQTTIARPEHYRIEANARSQGGDPPVILRLEELPDANYKISGRVEMSPIVILIQDLIAPIDLPVRDSHIESYLIPMIRASLVATPLWRSAEIAQAVLAEGVRAEEELSRESFNYAGGQTNYVGTTRGF